MRYTYKIFHSGILAKIFSDSDFFSLYYFATNKKLSTYQLSKFLSTTKFKMDYKNVHKKVKKFHSIQLIEEVKEKDIDEPHAAIFYRLSDIGVFYTLSFLYDRRSLFKKEQISETIHGLLLNYGENDFFYVFVYPFFNIKTILNLESETILEYFLNYCKKCYYRIKLKVFDIEHFYDTSVLIRWKYFLNYENDNLSKNKVHTWLMDIQQRFRYKKEKDLKNCLDWIDNDISIKQMDEDAIIITNNEKTLFLKLEKTQKRMNLFIDKKNILQFDIKAEDNNDYVVNPFDISEKYIDLLKLHIIDYKYYRKYDFEENMVLPFISIGKFRDADIEYWYKLEPDLISLINDERFYKIVIKTINEFEKSSINILKCKA